MFKMHHGISESNHLKQGLQSLVLEMIALNMLNALLGRHKKITRRERPLPQIVRAEPPAEET